MSNSRILHTLGTGVAVFGVVFVGFHLFEQGSKLDQELLSARIWLITIACSLAYGAANLALVVAWSAILAQFGSRISSPREAVRIYGVSQLAKYVPGNIFHIASRQALGVARGIDGWVLAKSAAWELGLIAAAGALFSVLLFPNFLDFLPLWSAPVTLIAVLAGLGLALKKLIGREMALALYAQAGFLLISGLLFAVLLGSISSQADSLLSNGYLIVGSYILAWLVGFITPGAPAGAGVRELVLLMLLSGVSSDSSILAAILLSRFVTVSGDVLFFGFASRLKRAGFSRI